MIGLLLAALCGHNGASPYVEDAVDIVEVNSVVCADSGEVTLTQVIWWDWDGSRFIVRDWRHLKVSMQPVMSRDGRYRCDWVDNGVLRRVEAVHRRLTVTFNDPEAANRAVVPLDDRRKLRNR